MNRQKMIENYADLILQRGVGLKKGEILVIEETSVTAIEFIRIITRKAYELGAKDVVVHFADQELTKIRLQHADLDTIESVPDWWVESREMYGNANACFLRLNNDSPDGLCGVSDEKLAVWKRAITKPLQDLSFSKKENRVKWSASAVPGVAWAQKVFPGAAPDKAVELLWDAMLKSCYVTEESGIAGWDAHIAEMTKNVEALNRLELRKLHFKNGKGTDLTVEICQDGVFAGGICHCPEPDGDLFAPNIPTEEILTTPHKDRINGEVYSTMPFSYAGNIVDGMWLRFEDGLVTEYSAEVGEEVLKGILVTDEGSRRLGEVALVPFDSPINEMGILFYNTLFDENASCHLALGAGYTDVIRGEDRSKEALEAKGLNSSALHVDFMFGSADMQCVGTCADGREVTIFKDGLFAFQER